MAVHDGMRQGIFVGERVASFLRFILILGVGLLSFSVFGTPSLSDDEVGLDLAVDFLLAELILFSETTRVLTPLGGGTLCFVTRGEDRVARRLAGTEDSDFIRFETIFDFWLLSARESSIFRFL